MSDSINSDRVLKIFLKQYNSIYHRFHFACREIIYLLFKRYLSSFYGIKLWFNDTNKNRAFHYNVSVGYHKAVKWVAGLCTWDSIHFTCESVGVNVFRHLRDKRMFDIYLLNIKSENKSMMCLKLYFSFIFFHQKKYNNNIFQWLLCY